MRQGNDHVPGFVFNGREARRVHFLAAMRPSAWRAVAVQVYAISAIEFAGGGVAHAEAGGVLDDDPGVKQAPKFEHAEQQQEQNRQHQGKLQHALGFALAPLGALAP